MPKRIVYRGRKEIFKVEFFEDEAKTIPITPISSNYPEYTLFDPSNLAVATGTGVIDVSPGYWKLEWTPPLTSPLSDDTHKWRIEWAIVSADNDASTYVDTFEMVDEVVDASETLAQQFITLATSITRVPLKLTTQYASVKATVYKGGTNEIALAERSIDVGSISMVQENGGFVYYFDIPVSTLLEGSDYMVFWELRRTTGSQSEFLFDKVVCAHPTVLQHFPNVRMLIDKFQKRLGRIHGYEDPDIYEYLQRGREVVNSWYPPTYWQWSAFPPVLNTFIVMAAAWWGLNAQYILEADMMFSFSGQTVTLDVDRTGALDSAIGRFNDFLNEHLTKAKVGIVRASTPAGVVAVRPTRYNLLRMVFRVDRGVTITPNIADMVYSVFG